MQKLLSSRWRDYFAALLLFVLGLGTIVQGASYTVGSLTQMGPGFFPVVLGVLLVACGLALAIATRLSSLHEERTPLPPEWRAWALILVGLGAFVVLGKYGGLAPATFALVFVSALADRENTLRRALVLSLSMVTISVVVFWWALQLQFPLFTWG